MIFKHLAKNYQHVEIVCVCINHIRLNPILFRFATESLSLCVRWHTKTFRKQKYEQKNCWPAHKSYILTYYLESTHKIDPDSDTKSVQLEMSANKIKSSHKSDTNNNGTGSSDTFMVGHFWFVSSVGYSSSSRPFDRADYNLWHKIKKL